MKLPAILTRPFRRNRAPQKRPVQTTLKAATATARRGDFDDYDSAEPTTSLSVAFIIVFVLHVVAVVGIFIFNHIKSTRPALPAKTTASAPAKAPVKSASASEKAAVEARAEAAPEPRRESAARVTPSGVRIHHVQSGENLTKIATRYQMTVADLEGANKIDPKSPLQIGQILNIPAIPNATRQPAAVVARVEPPKPLPTAAPKALVATKPAASAPKPSVTKKAEPRAYTVDRGDTITYIAKRFDVTTDEIQKLNGISDPKKLQPGRKLKIPAKD